MRKKFVVVIFSFVVLATMVLLYKHSNRMDMQKTSHQHDVNSVDSRFLRKIGIDLDYDKLYEFNLDKGFHPGATLYRRYKIKGDVIQSILDTNKDKKLINVKKVDFAQFRELLNNNNKTLFDKSKQKDKIFQEYINKDFVDDKNHVFLIIKKYSSKEKSEGDEYSQVFFISYDKKTKILGLYYNAI